MVTALMGSSKRSGLILLASLGLLAGQPPAYPPPPNLITIPSAATLVRGSYALQARIQKQGGLITTLSAGITDRFQFGLSYGAGNLIGDDSLKWYPRPEANLKYRLIDESPVLPGISLGLDTQGLGPYQAADTLRRYTIKAFGAYLAASKNWQTLLGNLGFHGGLNYNFTETADGDRDLNIFGGLDLEFNPELALLLEYNAAFNENDHTLQSLAVNRGYLNAAARWTFVERLHIEIDFNNLLLNNERVEYFNRELKLTYIEYF